MIWIRDKFCFNRYVGANTKEIFTASRRGKAALVVMDIIAGRGEGTKPNGRTDPGLGTAFVSDPQDLFF
jgi:hypothetical protein